MKHFSSGRKWVIGTTLLGVFTFVLLNAHFLWFRWPLIAVHPIEAIPHQTAIILETADFAQLGSSQQDSLGIHQLLLAAFRTKGQALRSQIWTLSKGAEKPKVLLGLEKVAAREVGALLVLDLNTLPDSAFHAFTQSLEERVQPFNYDGLQYQMVQSPGEAPLLYYRFRNLLVASNYPVLIENAIRQLQDFRSSLLQDPKFKKIYKDKEALAHQLYLNFGNIARFLQAFVNPGQEDMLDIWGNFAYWLRVGFPHNSGSIEGSYVPVISDVPEKAPGVFQDLSPANNNKKYLLETWGPVLPDNTGLLSIQQGIGVLEQDKLYDNYILPWQRKEWGVAIINPRTSADPVVFLRSNSPESTEHYLTKFGERYGLLEDKDYQTFRIRKLMEGDLLSPFIRKLKLDNDQPYFTLIGDFVLFAESRLILESLIDKHIVSQTLQNEVDFQRFAENIPSPDAGLLYLRPASLFPVLKKHLNTTGDTFLDKNWDDKKLQWSGGWIMRPAEQTISLEMQVVKPLLPATPKANLVWRVALQSPVARAPETFWNPQKSAYEILVQDEFHQLYLLDESGGLLWKKRLDGPILSAIYQVDYQEDGNLQYLFNTSGKVYLLDSRGEFAGNYPLVLQSPATNGLCLTRLKRSYAYQFFLACENGHAYGFTKEGSPLPGWNPNFNVGRLEMAFLTFQRKGRDYIMMLSTSGLLQAYDSEGKLIYKKDGYFWTKMDLIETDRQNLLVLTDRSGQISLVNHLGTIILLKSEVKDSEQEQVYVAGPFQGTNYLIKLRDRQIKYYHLQNGELQQRFTYELNDRPDEIFNPAFSFPDASPYFGTLNPSEQQISLYSPETGLLDGFPLRGSTPFQIFPLATQNQNILITGLDTEILAYRIDLD